MQMYQFVHIRLLESKGYVKISNITGAIFIKTKWLMSRLDSQQQCIIIRGYLMIQDLFILQTKM